MRLVEVGKRKTLLWNSIFFVACAAGTSLPAVAAPTDINVAAQDSKLFFAPDVGHTWTYDVKSQGTTSINVQALASRLSPNRAQVKGQVEDNTFEITARVGIRVLAKQGDSYSVAIRLENPTYVVNGVEDKRVSVLTNPVMAKISKNGAISDFRFPTKFPEQAKLAIRALVDPLQVVLGGEQSATWNAAETTAAGRAAVSYRVGSLDKAKKVAHLSRTVTSARRSLAGNAGQREAVRMRTEIERSQGNVQWSLDGKGLVSISLDERTHSIVDNQRMATTETYYSAELVEDPVLGLPGTEDEAMAVLTDPAAARASFYTVPPSVDAQLKDVTWDDAKTAYIEGVLTSPWKLNHLMKYYLRKHPEHARPFAEALNERSLAGGDEDATNDILAHGFTSIAAASHTEAQQVLVDVISQSGWSKLSKEKARDAMFSVELPESFLIPAVWNQRTAIPTTGDRIDTAGLSIWTNLYGFLGSTAFGIPAHTDMVWENLKGRLNSNNPYEKARALVAMGNLNDPNRTLPAAEPYFTAEQDFLRARAFDIFRNSKNEAHFVAFAEYFAQEPNLSVRTEASAIALSMSPSPARNAWAAEQAANANDSVIQMRAVRMLGLSLEEYPDNEEALRGLLETVRNRDVRRTIYGFIKPNPRRK